MNEPDPSELRLRRNIELSISDGAAAGLTYRQIQDGLVEFLAQVTVAATGTKKELEDATEVVRHQLDERIVHYDRIARNAGCA